MFEKMVEFFKSRKVTALIQPKITVDYHPFSILNDESVTASLREQWENLLQEIISSDTKIVKERKWFDYQETRQEKITVEIDGVTLKLEGPYYPNPNYIKPIAQMPKSDIERANENIDAMVVHSDLLNIITHCSERKYEALIEFIKATRATRSTNS